MSAPLDNEALILDLIADVAAGPRPYAEVMAAWRTSCPRLPVWEDAIDLGFVELTTDGTRAVQATESGLAFLRRRRRG